MKHEKYQAVLPVAIIGIILLILIPIPSFLLDSAITLSLIVSVATLFLSFSVKEALELSAFPSILLFLTFFRLSLNIATTRMIFSSSSAGHIIPTFGKFMAESNPSIGFIIFLLITLVNFIVITKGGGRIAEVAARFTLEAFPGKQLAIDSDLNRHAISFDEAKKLRKKMVAEAEFYGAMDGASKFVRGEAIASLMITFINIAGAFWLSFFTDNESLLHFLSLVIGDGLVTQIPSLLISLAAASMVSRVSEERLSEVIPAQMLSRPKILISAALLIFLISLIPGMPKIVMWTASCFLFIFSKRLEKNRPKEEGYAPISFHLGVDRMKWKKMLASKLEYIENDVYESTGLKIPSIAIVIDRKIKAGDSQLNIKGSITSLDIESVDLIDLITEEICNASHKLISRQNIHNLLEKAKSFDPTLIDELHIKKIGINHLLKIFKNLLKEHLSIHNIASILEIVVENVTNTIDVDALTELVRKEIAKDVISRFSKEGSIYAITFDSEVEEMVAASFDPTKSHNNIFMRPKTLENIEKKIASYLMKAKKEGIRPIILASTNNRLHLSKLLEKQQIAIFSYSEIEEKQKISTLGKITNDILI